MTARPGERQTPSNPARRARRTARRHGRSTRPSTDPVTADRSGRLRTFIPVLTIVIATTLAYSNTFHAEFQLDDDHAIQQNQAIHSLAGAMARIGSSTRSLTEFTFAINYAIGGLQP